MKVLFVRHADPDYERDSLTEKGWREAECLAKRLTRLDVEQFYVSPLGRAKDTASLTLNQIGKKAEECEWLREFAPRIMRPDCKGDAIVWDWLPEDWTAVDAFYDKERWKNEEVLRKGAVPEEYNWVITSFDQVLAQHGYVREKNLYRVTAGSSKTIVFVCHFGLECVLLSHLLNISPMVIWHGFCAAPSSVTTLVTEERRKGKAYFRMSSFGDISHLYADGEEPSTAARFCERFENEQERHD